MQVRASQRGETPRPGFGGTEPPFLPGCPTLPEPHVATKREALGIPSGGGFHVCIALRYGCAGLNERLLEMKLVSFQGAQKSSRTTVLYVLM